MEPEQFERLIDKLDHLIETFDDFKDSLHFCPHGIRGWCPYCMRDNWGA